MKIIKTILVITSLNKLHGATKVSKPVRERMEALRTVGKERTSLRSRWLDSHPLRGLLVKSREAIFALVRQWRSSHARLSRVNRISNVDASAISVASDKLVSSSTRGHQT